MSSYIGARVGGGGVRGCTYVLTLGIAYFRPISKDVPNKRVRTIDLSSYRNYPGIIILIAQGNASALMHFS